jgi:hypothetical protein
MKLSNRGKSTSQVEVTNISQHGFWILVNKEEFFLPYEEYPWFKETTVSKLTSLQLIHNDHLYWPELDVDLSLKILKNPKAYKLKFQTL